MANPNFRITKRRVMDDDKEQIEAYGKSTATKPSGYASGSTFIAVDTKKIYMYEESDDTWYDWTSESSSGGGT